MKSGSGNTPGTSPRTWAAFDFDGTMTRSDSLLPFLRQLLGTRRLVTVLAMESPWLAAYAASLLSNERAKERLLRRALGGMRQERLQTEGQQFALKNIPALLRPAMGQRLRQHLALGHTCVLVTASLTVYTLPWALNAGFTHVLGSELEFDEYGITTGRLQGGNCYGATKEKRLRALLGDFPLHYAYGDSRGDREMLAMAATSCIINASNGYGNALPDLTH